MRIVMLSLFVLVLAGCGSDDDAAAPTVPERVEGVIEFELEARSDSNVAGVLGSLEQVGGDRTRVSVEGLDQGDPGYVAGENVIHLHEGTCDEPGAAVELEPSVEGTSTTVVDVALGAILTSEYAIEVHLAPAGQQGGSNELDPLACGDAPSATS